MRNRNKKIIFLLLSFLIFIPALSLAGTVDLPETGQTTCYDSAGNVIDCPGTGQDGDIKAGVAWPSPRFTDNGDGTVTDNLTGLMWTKGANAPGPAACFPATVKTWQGALDYVACLNANKYMGYTDWRLPNRKELHSLTDFQQYQPALPSGHPFQNITFIGFWSSTTIAEGVRYAWVVDMWEGDVGYGYNKANYYYVVWPVRAGSGVCVKINAEVCDGISTVLMLSNQAETTGVVGNGNIINGVVSITDRKIGLFC